MIDNELTLVVKEAKPQDIARGIIRLDSTVFNQIGLNVGDPIQILGNERRKTAALAWPGLPEDKQKSIIRMDPATRRNAKVCIDERVKIKKIDL